MDLDKIKEIIVSTLLQIYYLIKNNKNVVGLIIFIIIVLIFTYFYSEKVRVSRKLSYLNNALSYESHRLQIDFCGNSNNTVDKLLATIKTVKNGIKIIDDANNKIKLIASGGVAVVEDLHRLREMGCEGAIVGKAFYEGRISFKELREFV